MTFFFAVSVGPFPACPALGARSLRIHTSDKLNIEQRNDDFFSSDKLGPTVFAPVKIDFVGNIKVSGNIQQSSRVLKGIPPLSYSLVDWCILKTLISHYSG